MIKSLLIQIFVHIQILICYITLGVAIPALVDIEIPIIFLMTWFIAPKISTILAFKLLNYMKVNRARLHIVLSFLLNLIILLIYTWYESTRPHIEGDFLDFRGLLLLVFGIGQIIGIIYAIFNKENVVE